MTAQMLLIMGLLVMIAGLLMIIYSLVGANEQLRDRLDLQSEQIKGIFQRLSVIDRSIQETNIRIDGESDVIVRMIEDHRKLKNNAERTHMIALQPYNTSTVSRCVENMRRRMKHD